MQYPCHFQARDPRHPHVNDEQLIKLITQKRKRLIATLCSIHPVTFLFQRFGKQLATHFVIIRNQNARAHVVPSTGAGSPSL